MTHNEVFHHIARRVSHAIGTPVAFVIALLLIVLWGASGPLFGFSDTWQLIINTGTTVITFLVVFLIQNTQNHDSRALHLKLDELLHVMKNARNSLIDLEELGDEELAKLEAEFRRLRRKGDGQAVQRARDLKGAQS